MLTVKKPLMLDFGAAGKGYLVDLVGQVLRENGVQEFCIDAGGDILNKGKIGAAPVRIGLENPHDIKQVIGVCELKNASICGSAGNRRTWGDFTHIINPKTMTSPRHIAAVWVVAETALVADALATALFFVPPALLVHKFQFEYVIINSDSSFLKSAGFPGEIFAV
jgi:thiamine biosynthesis lipoprotein